MKNLLGPELHENRDLYEKATDIWRVKIVGAGVLLGGAGVGMSYMLERSHAFPIYPGVIAAIAGVAIASFGFGQLKEISSEVEKRSNNQESEEASLD